VERQKIKIQKHLQSIKTSFAYTSTYYWQEMNTDMKLQTRENALR